MMTGRVTPRGIDSIKDLIRTLMTAKQKKMAHFPPFTPEGGY